MGLSIPMLWTEELRLRKVETPTQAHTADKEPEMDTGVHGSRIQGDSSSCNSTQRLLQKE